MHQKVQLFTHTMIKNLFHLQWKSQNITKQKIIPLQMKVITFRSISAAILRCKGQCRRRGRKKCHPFSNSIFSSFRRDANFPARNCLNLPHSPLLYFLRGGREDIKVLEIFTELFTNCVKLTLFGQQLLDITFNKFPLFIKSKTQTVFHTHKETDDN